MKPAVVATDQERVLSNGGAQQLASQVPVFITGMPRSGSTWVVLSLNAHPEVAGIGEGRFFSKRWVAPTRVGTWTQSQLDLFRKAACACPFDSTVPLEEDLQTAVDGWMKRTSRADLPAMVEQALASFEPGTRPIDAIDAIGRAFCEREGKTRWIEKSASDGVRMLRTITQVPNARFIVILRAPAGFVRSYKFRGLTGRPEQKDRFARRYHPFLAAWVWRQNCAMAFKMKLQFPEQVSIHVLGGAESNRAVLEQACTYLEVEPHEAMFSIVPGSNSSFKGLKPAEKPQLDAGDWAWIRLLCKSDDSRFAIPDDAPRFNSLAFARTLLALPAWSVRIARDTMSNALNPLRHILGYLRR